MLNLNSMVVLKYLYVLKSFPVWKCPLLRLLVLSLVPLFGPVWKCQYSIYISKILKMVETATLNRVLEALMIPYHRSWHVVLQLLFSGLDSRNDFSIWFTSHFLLSVFASEMFLPNVDYSYLWLALLALKLGLIFAIDVLANLWTAQTHISWTCFVNKLFIDAIFWRRKLDSLLLNIFVNVIQQTVSSACNAFCVLVTLAGLILKSIRC